MKVCNNGLKRGIVWQLVYVVGVRELFGLVRVDKNVHYFWRGTSDDEDDDGDEEEGAVDVAEEVAGRTSGGGARAGGSGVGREVLF